MASNLSNVTGLKCQEFGGVKRRRNGVDRWLMYQLLNTTLEFLKVTTTLRYSWKLAQTDVSELYI